MALSWFANESMSVCLSLCFVYRHLFCLCRPCACAACLHLCPASYFGLCGRPFEEEEGSVCALRALRYSCDLLAAICCGHGAYVETRSSRVLSCHWSDYFWRRRRAAARPWSATCWGETACWCSAEDISTWKTNTDKITHFRIYSQHQRQKKHSYILIYSTFYVTTTLLTLLNLKGI